MGEKVDKVRVWIADDLYYEHPKDGSGKVGRIVDTIFEESVVISDVDLQKILDYMNGVAKTETRTYVKEKGSK